MVDVSVGGWEHDCCGPLIRRGDRVRWTCVRAGGRLEEVHHVLDGLDVVAIAGVVTELRARTLTGNIVRVDRVPDGRALRGLDDDADGVVLDAETGERVVVDESGFIVTVDETR